MGGEGESEGGTAAGLAGECGFGDHSVVRAIFVFLSLSPSVPLLRLPGSVNLSRVPDDFQ